MKKKAEKMTQQTLLGFIKKPEKKESTLVGFPYSPSKSCDFSSSSGNSQDISSKLETESLNLGDTSFNGILTPVTLNIHKLNSEKTREKENFSSFNLSPLNYPRRKLNYKEDNEDEDDMEYILFRRKKSKIIHDSDDEFKMTISEDDSKNNESDSCPSVSSNQEENHLKRRKLRKLINKDKKRDLVEKFEKMEKNMEIENKYSSIDSSDKKSSSTSLFSTQEKSSEVFNHEAEENYKFLLPEYRRDADGNLPSSPNYDERTLYIPPAAYKSFKPFEKQYWDIKSKFMDTLVFFQKGRFYELYQIDADIGHQLFNLKMTDRVGTMRMVGVPDANYEHWASKFIEKGFKIARVDQLETSLGKEMRDKSSKVKDEKVVRRELVHVLTSGTLINEGIMKSDLSTYCMAIKEEYEINSSVVSFGICFVDAATANFKITYFKDDLSRTKLYTLITQIKPKELILEKANVTPKTIKLLKNSGIDETTWNFIKPGIEFWDEHTTESQFLINNYFKDNDFNNWPPALQKARNYPIALSSVGGLVWYLKTLKMDKNLCTLGNFEWYDPIQEATSLILDGQTLKNLEIFSNSYDGGLDGTLIKLLNRCTTPFGKRLFRLWLCHPLRSVDKINERLDAVELLSDLSIRKFIVNSFKTLPDLERMISRIHSKHCRSKDFISVLEGFNTIYEILDYLSKNLKQDNGLLWKIINDVPDLVDILNDWKKMFDWKKCKDEDILIPNPGTEKDFDNSQNKIEAIEDELHQMERDYRKQFKLPQITFRDIGKEIYQIEVPKSIEVPCSWIKLSCTKSVNRYWSPELKIKVRQLQEAREAHKIVIKNVRDSFFAKFDENYFQWLKVVKSIAHLDCLTSLSISSMEFGEPSCRPQVIDSEYSILEFDELQHPCVVPSLSSSFIPNNIKLGGSKDDPTIVLLTGPNMAGKSTLLRQTCVAVILAQLGCRVPARRALLTPMDSIKSRLGANDNIFGSQSTFMVELLETKKIIEESTSKSLVILDELGRGTSTYDGLAIAYSTLHKLSTYVGCLGFFSTHYHSLVKDFENHPKIAAHYMAAHVDENERKITFLYELRPGVSSKSYGMNVAAMAGIPDEIIKNAEIAAKKFEISSQSARLNKTNYESSISLASQSDFSWLMKLLTSKDPIPSILDLKRQLYVIANTF
ncbi:hypothetical protein T552_00243 [Pneumocystis carinii B80]|uniref:DNA mismatch repair protein n=1 Tax=Pneumocystis carinii (strain B80) TaxID=1408658 RepID=A0A0W4ZTB3_PNEC8|nr:hypothetical protein T552_00243 [Pneumocystis carinii B80]KTW31605.1 hypothetical protein T552_00243 [Pneumocystis carinii B80]